MAVDDSEMAVFDELMRYVSEPCCHGHVPRHPQTHVCSSFANRAYPSSPGGIKSSYEQLLSRGAWCYSLIINTRHRVITCAGP